MTEPATIPAAAPAAARPLDVVVEGWRWILHSYGIVNQYQLLELARRGDIRLFHRDRPYLGARWKPLHGLMAAAEEAAIAAVPPPPDGLVPDVTLRMTSPLDLSAAAGGAVLVFATADAGCIPDVLVAGNRPLAAARAESGAFLLTPSNWSKLGLIRSGVPAEAVYVLPHGVDPARFRPASPERRAEIRARLGWTGKFVFLNLGAMTANKGIAHICRAAAQLAPDFPEMVLFFKGADHTYRSTEIFGQALASLDAGERAALAGRAFYSGSTLSFDEIAELYQAADAYVSPYASEGFNMPVLEAAACGLPVICSRGGPTDDFVADDFARRLSARVVQQNPVMFLEIDFADLVLAMRQAMTDGAARERARLAGPHWVHGNYSWARVGDRLAAVLRQAAGRAAGAAGRRGRAAE